MSETVRIRLKKREDRSYEVWVASGALNALPAALARLAPGGRIAVIADDTVAALYGEALAAAFTDREPPPLYTFPAGEASKTRETKAALEDSLLAAGFGRDTCLVAFGGGVTGDLAGYLAATYMRGVPFIQVPTTLLAQVDSSVGGKTGVDTPHGKNLIGAFHQPLLVLADPGFLTSLPEEEYLSGLGEVLKHALLFDRRMVRLLSEEHDRVFAKDNDLLIRLVADNVRCKAAIVMRDEKEGGLRQLLNFGHTAGHAIELLGEYRIAHGLAVMAGMVLESLVAVEAGLIPEETAGVVVDLVRRYCPSGILEGAVSHRHDELVDAMRLDKKNRAGRIHVSLPARPGRPRLVSGKAAFPVAEALFGRACERFRSLLSG